MIRYDLQDEKKYINKYFDKVIRCYYLSNKIGRYTLFLFSEFFSTYYD